jgi:Reverse transcriptase (RNA-dependent DNA polymerase)
VLFTTNKYLLPLIPELIDNFKNAKIFTKLDLRWGYHNVQIKEGDEHIAAFIADCHLWEPTVMFFGLQNSPSTFQAMMNGLFDDLIHTGKIMIYMDDFPPISKNTDEQSSRSFNAS